MRPSWLVSASPPTMTSWPEATSEVRTAIATPECVSAPRGRADPQMMWKGGMSCSAAASSMVR